MTTTNTETGTTIEAITENWFRISTPVPPEVIPGGLTFNQFLILDDEPLLFHTGPRGMFPLVSEAVASVMPLERLRYVAFSHVEADECGSLNEWLEAAPRAEPVCSQMGALVQMNDLANRPPRALADGETLSLGKHRLIWIDTPHLPHGMECGYMFDEHSGTMLSGDLFTQPGVDVPALTADANAIWEPSDAFRKGFPYHATLRDPQILTDKLAAYAPERLACMHGSSYEGDGAALIKKLGAALAN